MKMSPFELARSYAGRERATKTEVRWAIRKVRNRAYDHELPMSGMRAVRVAVSRGLL